MNNYRKTSINHPPPGLIYFKHVLEGGGGAYLREEAYLI